MNKKLYVGNLNFDTNLDDLKSLFAGVGPVASATIITDGSGGRSRGFGFVEMETEQDAKDAIDRLNNHEIDQRNITVSEARPPRERSFGGGDNRRDGSGGGRKPSRGGGGGRRRF